MYNVVFKIFKLGVKVSWVFTFFIVFFQLIGGRIVRVNEVKKIIVRFMVNNREGGGNREILF